MKPYLCSLACCFLLSCLPNISYGKLPNHVGKPIHSIQRSVERFRSEIRQINTVNDLCKFLRTKHRYQYDKGHPFTDDVKSPYRLYLERRGDCEDYALQAAYIAMIKGWPTATIRIDGESGAHVFTIINDTKYLHVICTLTLGVGNLKLFPETKVQFPLPDTIENLTAKIKAFYNKQMDEELIYSTYINIESIKESEVDDHENGKSTEQEWCGFDVGWLYDYFH